MRFKRQLLIATIVTTTESAQCVGNVHSACGTNFRAYNSTFYPNLLGQWTELEAQASFSIFFPLRQMECSKYLDLFLCSTLSPACANEDLSGTLPFNIPIPPCQSLCDIVFDECATMIEEFGVIVPPEFSCDRFPEHNSEHPCMPVQSHTEELPPGTLRWNIEEPGSLIPREMQCPLYQRSEYPEWIFAGLERCTQPCKPMHHEEGQVTLIRVVVGLFAAVTALVSAFVVFVFLHDIQRFKYPERPTLFFAFCYLAISVICLIGLISPESIVCADSSYNSDVMDHATVLIQGATSRPCTILFMLFFYFSTAGLCWWLALTIAWGLTAIFKWSSEAISTRSALLHLIGWAIPGIMMIIAVSRQEIQGDAYLGICGLSSSHFSITYLSMVPLVLVTCFGTISYLFGMSSLKSVKDELDIDDRGKSKLDIFVKRMTVFSIIVIIPQITLVGLRYQEAAKQEIWEKHYYGENCESLFVPCLSEDEMKKLESPTAFFIIGKYLVTLLPAFAPLTWIANEKTIRLLKTTSSSSTMTSSTCIKPGSINDPMDDSRTDQSLSDTGLMPCPKELMTKYKQDRKLLYAV